MKTRNKLISMVLSLSLVLTLLCGIPAAANENLILGWGLTTAGSASVYDTETGVMTLPLNSNSNGMEEEVPVTAGQMYQLTFSYNLPVAAKGTVKICALDAGKTAVTTLVTTQNLAATAEGEYKTMAIGFTPGTVMHGNGSALEAGIVRITFAVVEVAGSTDSFTLKDISMTAVTDAELLANGSAEILDTLGNPIGITGGTLIREGAKDGKNMMLVTKDTPMDMQLALTETASRANIRGFIKPNADFAADSSVTVSIKKKADDTAALSQKTFQLPAEGAEAKWTDLEADTWEYIRFSGMQFDANLVVSVSVSGDGGVYVDGVTIEKDNNIFRHAAFIPTLEGDTGYNETWQFLNITGADKNFALSNINDGSEDAKAHELYYMTDGNCPDGQNWVKLYGTSDGIARDISFRTTNSWTVEPGETYKLSYWINSTVYQAQVALYTGDTPVGDVVNSYTSSTSWSANNAKHTLRALPYKTNGEWEQVTHIITIPEGYPYVNFRVVIANGYVKNDSASYVALNMPVLEKLENNTVGFYKDSPLTYEESWYGIPFVNKTAGTPVETRDDVQDGEALKAVYVTATPEVTSGDTIILAAYKTDAEGNSQLVALSVGEAEAPAVPEKYLSKDGTALKGVNFPTATISAADLSEATEIRAYVWNSVSGLQPTEAFVALTK